MKTCLSILLAASLAAGLTHPVTAQSSQPPSQKDEPTAQLLHIDVTRVDSTTDPCSDFYAYTCNKLNAANPMPPDQAVWGVYGSMIQWNRQVLRQILEKNEEVSSSRTPNEARIGDFYASCMSQAEQKTDDLKTIQPLLVQIQQIHDVRGIAPVLAAMHSSFGSTWQGDENQTPVALFGYGPQPDFNDVSRVVASLDQGGLGMPTRDFYLRTDADSKKIRDKYVDYIVALLKLSGTDASEAQKQAATILRLETAMAQVQMDNVARRDPNKVNNRYTLDQVKQLVPAFDWDSYLSAIGAAPVPLYEVSAPDFFRALNTLLTTEDLATWKIYLRWQLLRSASELLGSNWRNADFAFYRLISGQQQQTPDWRRCTRAVDSNVGDALGQVYVAQVFPPESKARVLKMVHDIEAAMGRDIDSVTWMQPETKRQAHLKLAAVMDKIGYPDKWIDYTNLSVTRDNYVVNTEHATAFELKRQLSFINKPIDRTLWYMTPPTVDAYEDPQSNTINFPAGMLQPVYFDAQKDDVLNYGAEGSIIGHELTHDFDDQGRKFDLNGNLHDWWTAEDTKEYEERGQCIAQEYTGPVPGVPGVQQNGKLTQGEDTADNGGIHLALSALIEDLKQQGKTLDDKDEHGLTNLQRFFIAYGTSWCDEMRPELERTLVLTDTHSITMLRVNNVLANMPEFQKAFSCKDGQPMVHANRCRVW